jgi:iron(III) transport system substrate-binding protein
MGFHSTWTWTSLGGLASVVAVAGMIGVVPVQAAPCDQALQARYELEKKEGQVIMYGDQSVELIQALGSAFQKKFPGIGFDFFRGDTTQILERFESETAAGRHNMDMLMTTATRSSGPAKKGLLAPYVSPVALAYPPELQPTSGFWQNYGLNSTSFAYNTDLVKPEDAPKTWHDLLDPKWKGKIGMQDPKSGGGGAHTWIMKMHRELGEAEWREYMDVMGTQISKYGRYFPIREALASGEIAIHLAAYPDFTEPLKIKGAPIEWAVPEFVYYLGLTLQINASAPNPNSAKLLLDFLLTPEAQQIIANAGKIPADPDKRPGGYARLNDTKLIETDYSIIYDMHDKEWFNTEIRKYFAANR